MEKLQQETIEKLRKELRQALGKDDQHEVDSDPAEPSPQAMANDFGVGGGVQRPAAAGNLRRQASAVGHAASGTLRRTKSSVKGVFAVAKLGVGAVRR